MARESVRNLLEYKKNFSMRDQSLGNSQQGISPEREVSKPDLNLTSSLAQIEIIVEKPSTPEK